MKKGEGDGYIIKHSVYCTMCKFLENTLYYYIHIYLLKNKMTMKVTVHMCKVWKSQIFWTSFNSNSFLLKIHAVQYVFDVAKKKLCLEASKHTV
jgi:hypothetical protein